MMEEQAPGLGESVIEFNQSISYTAHQKEAEEISWDRLRGGDCLPWSGLLPGDREKPKWPRRRDLNAALRKELIKYGELAQACTDGFEADRDNPLFGRARRDAKDFLPTALWIGQEVHRREPELKVGSAAYQMETFIHGASFKYEPKKGCGGLSCCTPAMKKKDIPVYELVEKYNIMLSQEEKRYFEKVQEVDEEHAVESVPMPRPEEIPGGPDKHEPPSSKQAWIGYIAVAPIDLNHLKSEGVEVPKDDPTWEASAEPVDIVVATRGTLLEAEWRIDTFAYRLGSSDDYLDFPTLSEIADDRGQVDETLNVKIHPGFRGMYTTPVVQDGEEMDTTKKPKKPKYTSSPRNFIRRKLKALVKEKNVKSITFVGHSLGGALAVLAGTDIGYMRYKDITDPVEKKKWDAISINVYGYAAPRVGNADLRRQHEITKVKVMNVVNVRDIVPALPVPAFHYCDAAFGTIVTYFERFRPYKLYAERRANTGLWKWVLSKDKGYAYTNSGVRLLIDSRRCKLFRKLGCVSCCVWRPVSDIIIRHTLEGYLYLLATQHVTPFDDPHIRSPRVFRDIALLNKSWNILDDVIAKKLLIPERWWNPDDNTGLNKIPSHYEGHQVFFWRQEMVLKFRLQQTTSILSEHQSMIGEERTENRQAAAGGGRL